MDCVAWICEVITPHYLYKALWHPLGAFLHYLCPSSVSGVK